MTKILFLNKKSSSSRIYKILNELDYDLFVCNKTEHAQEILEKEKINVFFSKINEKEDCSELELFPKKICLIAVADSNGFKEECSKHGADEYIVDTPSLTKEDLLSVINKCEILFGFRSIKEKIKMLECVTHGN